MHHSRLAAFAIDVPAETADAAARFWSGALTPDAPEHTGFDPADPYVTVGWVAGREVFVQRVGEPSGRLHLDIETDDVDAEVARLEALGARRLRKVQSWWVMEDPSGQPFCVVRPQTADFPGDAATWP